MALFNFFDGPIHDIKGLIIKFRDGKWIKSLPNTDLVAFYDEIAVTPWKNLSDERLILMDLASQELDRRYSAGTISRDELLESDSRVRETRSKL